MRRGSERGRAVKLHGRSPVGAHVLNMSSMLPPSCPSIATPITSPCSSNAAHGVAGARSIPWQALVLRSHTRTVLSMLALMKESSSGDMARDVTRPRCPRK